MLSESEDEDENEHEDDKERRQRRMKPLREQQAGGVGSDDSDQRAIHTLTVRFRASGWWATGR
jgi:hypothetical protein